MLAGVESPCKCQVGWNGLKCENSVCLRPVRDMAIAIFKQRSVLVQLVLKEMTAALKVVTRDI